VLNSEGKKVKVKKKRALTFPLSWMLLFEEQACCCCSGVSPQ